MGGTGGMLLASTTTLLMPSLPGACSKLKMAGFALVKRRAPLSSLGFRITCACVERLAAPRHTTARVREWRVCGFIGLGFVFMVFGLVKIQGLSDGAEVGTE